MPRGVYKRPLARHGTHARYVKGCRCDRCREASNTYKRKLYARNLQANREKERAKKAAARAADPEPSRRHALATYYRHLDEYRKRARQRMRKRSWLTRQLSLQIDRAATGQDYKRAALALSGELAQLVAEQIRDDASTFVRGGAWVGFDEAYMARHYDPHDLEEDEWP